MKLDDIIDRAHVVALPMREKFRGITVREALLIDGPAGWGEFSPFVEYPPEEAAAWLRSGLEAAVRGLPRPAFPRVAVNATVPAVRPEKVEEVLARFPGCATVKVKVAEGPLAEDIARVEAVRALRPDAAIRVDANRRWSVAEAIAAGRALGKLEYMEQPCATVAELDRVRRAGIPVAADESIRRAADPFAVDGHVDVGVLKVAPLGGARRVLGIARRLHMRVTVASALDTAVGMNGGLAAAGSLEGGLAAGLATGRLFIEDVAAPRRIEGGTLSTAPVAPDPARLAGLAAAPDRRAWWIERVARCLDVLAARGDADRLN